MTQGYIATPEKTDDEKENERWNCYQFFRQRYPNSIGKVDLFSLEKEINTILEEELTPKKKEGEK